MIVIKICLTALKSAKFGAIPYISAFLESSIIRASGFNKYHFLYTNETFVNGYIIGVIQNPICNSISQICAISLYFICKADKANEMPTMKIINSIR